MIKLLKALNFFRFLDEDGVLSLTNIAMMVVIVKVAFAQFDWAGAAALLTVIGAYSVKRWTQRKTPAKVETASVSDALLASLRSDIDKLNIRLGVRRGS